MTNTRGWNEHQLHCLLPQIFYQNFFSLAFLSIIVDVYENVQNNRNTMCNCYSVVAFIICYIMSHILDRERSEVMALLALAMGYIYISSLFLTSKRGINYYYYFLNKDNVMKRRRGQLIFLTCWKSQIG